MTELTRRRALRIGATAVVVFAVNPAAAQPGIDEIVAAFTRGRVPLPEGLVIEMPDIAENSNAVPVSVKLTQLFTDTSWCEEFLLIAEGNPHPLVSRFLFERRMGMAEVAIRMRLAQSQDILVLARMNDGTVLSQKSAVTVTDGGCGL